MQGGPLCRSVVLKLCSENLFLLLESRDVLLIEMVMKVAVRAIAFVMV